MPAETVPLIEASGRVAAEDIASDMDVSPFAHAAMDGFAVRLADFPSNEADLPVELDVIAEVPAGATYEGSIEAGQCVRIMTGAALPADADAVVKYEIVENVTGDGKTGSRVRFASTPAARANIREAGEEAKEGEVIVRAGEIINPAGIGFLAGCGASKQASIAGPALRSSPSAANLSNLPKSPAPAISATQTATPWPHARMRREQHATAAHRA